MGDPDLKALREKAVARDADGYVNMIVGTEVILAMIERIERYEKAIIKAASAPGIDWLEEQLELGRLINATPSEGSEG